MLKKLLVATLVTFTAQVTLAASPTLDEELATISRDHIIATYHTDDLDERSQRLDALLARAIDLQKRYPTNAMAHAWIGWLYNGSAGLQTNPQEMAARWTKARTHLEAAVAIDPDCCFGYAYVALAMIHQVPIPGMQGPPAVHNYFAKALAIDPNGVMANAQYAGFLLRAGDLENARKHANTVLAAPPIPDNPDQDRTSRELAQQILTKIAERTKK
jgi:hypothetical protein